ncbi:nicotinate phosphoribosyltransferase [Heyndrickxia sporothermodurans]|uniref:Nicotinate phosphoribosyltransferase n=1 Tax=Heyndrickxia sporothermodurans TaxID=46224 RepID=A0AB37HEN2_9BACI|nr:nicotinate phosphoribosyltransferase [Heyndrickxia sporothermodurans]MBL5767929.1 nicotinate phosphoribosyltransferase [Heyndrickxia sporothermodurans]MBL5771366.1 nicotinate phosphoribosyltransferase [Heyndrickxia sporothermodurans]MBL5775063.1 nicotinate phosphoribosyltransferase [Heyndrickxia sporothermodurans]MBL5778789.1 nicotinate phosphoribosyltransferase [Heyndrickxia sporothermodurans]MBL5782044.1 nicotinate phosphoribosyltransferase [Heyndrickxia sporothermodurans]
MVKLYKDDGFALHTDLYQINMAKTYWDDGIHERKAVFEVFFRKLPFDNGYAVYAGLERIVEYLRDFHFSETDIQYLREELNYDEEFLQYLSEMRFTGTVRSMKEGEIVFDSEPLIHVEAPLAQAQIIETALLNIVNYQTLIATKAARIKNVVGDQILMEFGTRRAHEMDAAVWGTRAAYIGGFDSTSNVRAGKRFGIPVSGTHAHAMVQAYRDDYTAFHKYAESHRDCVFLVDTYDTLKSGVPAAIRVAKELGNKINFIGIRLDSGDMAFLSKAARKMLDQAGFPNAKIVASSDLDEYTILHMKSQGAKIDMWGVGTKLITAFEQPALGAVYKMVSIEDENGVMQDTIKISSNAQKVTTPGLKKVYRIINTNTNKSEGDYIAMQDEDPQSQEKLKMFHPVHTYISKTVTDFEAKDLHHDIFVNGELVYRLPELKEIQGYTKESLGLLWEEYKRSLNPHEYPVDLSQKCWDNKIKNIEDVREKIAHMKK